MKVHEMISKSVKSLVVFAFAICFVSSATAHDVFQDVLKEEYTLKSFSCKNCHPDNDDRKLRTPFAERIYQVMKDGNYTAKYAAAVATDDAAKAKDPEAVGKDKGAVAEFEKVIAKDFKEAFKQVATQSISFDELIKQGMMNGARLDTKALAKKAKEGE